MAPLNIGLIGAGRIADLHALGYRGNDDARIAAVCDQNIEVAQARGVAWSLPADRVYTDYRDLLACTEIDGVEVLLPHHLHHRVTLDAFAAGKHVSVQKPMAMTASDSDEMIEAACGAGRLLRVYENFLFYPPIVEAKRLLDAGAIGEPIALRIKCTVGYSPNAWPVPEASRLWRRQPELCGGGPMTFDDGHHMFAIAWYLMGMAEEVHAWIGQTEIRPGVVLDTPAIISWRFPGQRIGSFESIVAKDLRIETDFYAEDDRIEITGSKGVIWVTRGHGRIGDQPPLIVYADGETRGYSGIAAGWDASFVAATKNFIAAIQGKERPFLDGAQGRDILRFTLAGQNSAATARSVRVSEVGSKLQ